MENIRVYKESELGYLKLNTFVESCNGILNFVARQKNECVKYQIFLEDIYFDIGQNWMYTAPITYDALSKRGIPSSWHSLCPRDYNLILDSDSFKQINDYAMAYVDCLLNNEEVDFRKVA